MPAQRKSLILGVSGVWPLVAGPAFLPYGRSITQLVPSHPPGPLAIPCLLFAEVRILSRISRLAWGPFGEDLTPPRPI